MDCKANSIIAALETKIDMLETELSYLNKILIDCGFPEGISTLKETVEEMLEEGSPHHSQSSQEI